MSGVGQTAGKAVLAGQHIHLQLGGGVVHRRGPGWGDWKRWASGKALPWGGNPRLELGQIKKLLKKSTLATFCTNCKLAN